MAAAVPKRREGGAAAVIYNLGRELECLGHSVTYIFWEDLVAPGSVPARFAELTFSCRLARYIQQNREKLSLVNLHAPAGLVYGIWRSYRRNAGYPPYVMTLHGLEERRVHVMRREAAKGRAWNFDWQNRLWHRFYHFPRFWWSIRTANGAHTVSRDAWNFLQLKYHLDAEGVAYIPHGVERRFFISRKYETGGKLRLLYAGTWLDQRGIFYIRDALRNLVGRIPEVTLTIAGSGVPGELLNRFFGTDLARHIVARSVVPADRMQELYAEHDVFVFPSLMEGLPCVVMEAMATGMPVVTTETCGMPDVVQNEVNGLLIPPANAAALEEAILRLGTSEELRRQLGSAARESMRRYTWEGAARQLEALFRHTLVREGMDEGGASPSGKFSDLRVETQA
jgi:glycosyltransferase involved in cell wall biosynthesis